MPKITLRLTDDEHAAIVMSAERHRRSIQSELIYRLFPPAQFNTGPPPLTLSSFKPDPKPKAAEKKGRR